MLNESYMKETGDIDLYKVDSVVKFRKRGGTSLKFLRVAYHNNRKTKSGVKNSISIPAHQQKSAPLLHEQ